MSHVDRFYDNMIDLYSLIHELISICYEKGYTQVNPNMVQLVGTFLQAYDRNKIIDNFIEYSHDYWYDIISRDEKSICNNIKHIFRDLPSDKVDAFRVLYEARDKQGNRIVDKEDIDAIWDFFDSLIKICVKYIHDKRNPNMKKCDDGKLKPVYKNAFFRDIKIQDYAKRYKIELTFPDNCQ